jgi:hypothetical protein
MLTPTTRKLSAAALAVVGVIHLILSAGYFSEQAYVGALFVAGGLFLIVLAVRLWRAYDAPSWLLGALTMAAMGIAFVLSRTTGLPGLHESEWELSGVVALALEAGFVAAAVAALSPAGDTPSSRAGRPASSRPARARPAGERFSRDRAPAGAGPERRTRVSA